MVNICASVFTFNVTPVHTLRRSNVIYGLMTFKQMCSTFFFRKQFIYILPGVSFSVAFKSRNGFFLTIDQCISLFNLHPFDYLWRCCQCFLDYSASFSFGMFLVLCLIFKILQDLSVQTKYKITIGISCLP